MNSSASNSESRQLRYLILALKMNPLLQTEDIVKLRSRYLGLKSRQTIPADVDGANLEERRAASVRTIERVREHFWQMKLDSLRKELAELNLDSFPDLKHAATRLTIAAANRDALPRLSQHKNFDSKLFLALKTVLVSSPRDVGSVKEKFRKRLRDQQHRAQAARMVRLLKRNVPEIYGLEQDWLESIARYRPPKTSQSGDAEEGYGFHVSGEWNWVVWVIVLVGIRLIRLLLMHS